MKWPDGSTEPKEIYLCPICGEERPGPEQGEYDYTQADDERDEDGYLICDGMEEHEPRRFMPYKVAPWDDESGQKMEFLENQISTLKSRLESANLEI